MLNPAPPKSLIKKKQLIIYKAKKTRAKVPKAKAPIALSKSPKKAPTKAPKKAVVVKEVKKVVICQNNKGYIIKLPNALKAKTNKYIFKITVSSYIFFNFESK
jgi:hypothetical protein